MEIIQKIALDLQMCSVYQHIHAKQGDGSSRILQIFLKDMGEPYQIPEGATAGLRCVKPDGKSVDNPVTIHQDGTLTVQLTEQILAVPGKVTADVYLIKDGAVLSTFCFVIQVQALPLGENLTSESEFLTLIDAITQTQALNQEIRTALVNGDFIGPAGPAGADGADGADGTEGKSAYDYALDGGYLGTEEEFAQKLAVEYIDWFGKGIAIPKASDLNDYTTNGKYYAQSESLAETLGNCPTTTNFVMFVFTRTSNVMTQLIITLTGKMYIRSKSTTAWRSWVAYTTSEEIETLTEGVKQELIAAAVQSDWSQNDESASDYVKKRPFWTTSEPAQKVALGEKILSVGEELFIEIPSDFVPVPGYIYTVIFNGTQYSCTAYRLADELGTVVIGNLNVSDLDADGEYENKGNGEPFAMGYWGENAVYFYTLAEGGYILLVKEPAMTVMVDEQTISVGDELNTPIPGGTAIVEGKRYGVVFNGVSYGCEAWKLDDPDNYYNYETTPVLLGSLGVSDLDPENKLQNEGNAEPFAIVDLGNGALLLYTVEAGDCTVSINEPVYRVVPMDEKYLPESVGSLVIRSSTPGSSKLFKVMVDDSGTMDVVEIWKDDTQ